MRFGKAIKASAFAGAIGLLSASGQAARLGHPGVSTTGVKGAPTQWQLLCDPANVTNGSTTTSYSAYDINGLPLAALGEVDPLSGFAVTAVELQVQYPLAQGTFSPAIPTNQFQSAFIEFMPSVYGAPVIINQSMFPAGAHETGIVQVFWEQFQTPAFGSSPAISVPPPPDGDVNTHMLIFNNLSGDPNAMATFMNYLDSGAAHGGVDPTPDFYSGLNPDPFTFSADPTDPNYAPQVDTQTVTFAPGTAPEPSSLALGGMIAGLGMLRRRRR